MDPMRKPLVAALVAAGLAGSQGLPEAQSTVFVPELAMLEGTLCGGPLAMPMRPILVAQAKTEVGPAGKAAASVLAAQPPAEPPLIPGLGKHSFRISTASREAQQFFDQGLRLAWGFNHAEAQRAFQKAQRLDPSCAMCYWGEAYVLGPNINVPMDPQANAPALAALARAKALAGAVSPREQALIAALGARYSNDPKLERPMLDQAYAAAMAGAAARYPGDNDILALYAEALMDRSPWSYWEAAGAKLRPEVAPLLETLETVLERDPSHVGAIHLYIHAVEASANPKRAERFADRLAGLAPNAGHLVHMPAHIYYRLGRYKDSLAINQRAVRVDEAYLAKFAPQGVYPLGYYPHNVHFVMVSAQMSGEGAIVVDAAAKLARAIPDEPAKAIPLLQPMKAAPYFAHAQFSDLPAVLALADPGADLPYLQVAWRYARGVAFAQNGSPDAARAQVAAIEAILARTDYSAFAAWGIPAREVGRIAAHVLRARIAQSGNDLDASVRELEQAAALQDALPYMEPPYWYYPVRQTLAAALVQAGRLDEAEDQFRRALKRAPNNGWSYYGLSELYKARGDADAAKRAQAELAKTWIGDRGLLELSKL